MERKYLSLGMGVNSVALMLLLLDEGEEFEAVFVDHHTDYPETYAYAQMLRDAGYEFTTIEPDTEGFSSVYDYCAHYEILPMRVQRFCTDKFKSRPMEKYCQKPCIKYIGIDYGEERRAKPSNKPGVTHVYPLVERGIDRQGCIDIIEAHGLPVPPKSGCYICPFQPRSEWVRLNREHPELWCKATSLENAVVARAEKAGFEPYLLGPKPLDQLVRAKARSGHYADDDQDSLWDDRRPCNCGL